MTICDQRDCTARAIREVWFDNGHYLWFCAHHAARLFPMDAELRFDPRPSVIVT